MLAVVSWSQVLHMECKETGEFAHRETTEYEQVWHKAPTTFQPPSSLHPMHVVQRAVLLSRDRQSETFNAEVVVEEHGSEEYVHLKSREDEYEFMESSMPRKHAPPPPPQTDQDGHPQPSDPQGETPFPCMANRWSLQDTFASGWMGLKVACFDAWTQVWGRQGRVRVIPPTAWTRMKAPWHQVGKHQPLTSWVPRGGVTRTTLVNA